MSRFAKIITVLILISLFVPLVALIFGLDSPNYSKEPLASFPAFQWRGSFGADFDRWWSERFPFRSALVTAYHKSLSASIGVSGSEQVVKGGNGWFYFAPTIKDYVGSEHLSHDDCEKIARSLAIQKHAVEHEGKLFLVCFAPNKSSIYPENMPWWINPIGRERPLQRLRTVLPDACYLEDVLLQEKETTGHHLYHPEDTHWNLLGASVAYRDVLSRLSLNHRALSLGAPVLKGDGWEGDLTNMLFPAIRSSDEQILFPGYKKEYKTKRPMRSYEDATIETINPNKDGVVLMFRDSFANAWVDFFSDTFHTVHYSRILPYRYDLLSEMNPDYVILELVERNIDSLLTVTPELIAPEAFSIEGEIKNTEPVSVAVEHDVRNGKHFYNFLPECTSLAESMRAVQLFDGQKWFEAFPIYHDDENRDGKRLYGFSLYSMNHNIWSRIRYLTVDGWYEAPMEAHHGQVS